MALETPQAVLDWLRYHATHPTAKRSRASRRNAELGKAGLRRKWQLHREEMLERIRVNLAKANAAKAAKRQSMAQTQAVVITAIDAPAQVKK